jgi:hypothetical protein
MSAYVSIIPQHTSVYVSIHQHTSAYVSIRQHSGIQVLLYYICVLVLLCVLILLDAHFFPRSLGLVFSGSKDHLLCQVLLLYMCPRTSRVLVLLDAGGWRLFWPGILAGAAAVRMLTYADVC